MEKKIENREEAFEIIELATNDLESLTRAFRLIQEICEVDNNLDPLTEKEESIDSVLLH